MRHIHIISFAVPYPPDYGGAIDVFYRIKALCEAGFSITLHCFEYDRPRSTVLERYCCEIHYYKRNLGLKKLFCMKPYAVAGRNSVVLLDNLLKDNDPIIFEGLVSCYYMDDQRLKKRIKIFRECNVEHDYYRQLAFAARSLYKKAYYAVEAYKFKLYEPVLRSADCILALSHDDIDYFRCAYPQVPVEFVPCFHQNVAVTSKPGIGGYILYQGNLELAENVRAALFLCRNVFSRLPFRCVVAGRNPASALVREIAKSTNISLVANPDADTMDRYISDAHIHLLVTFQGTGMKLKLLNTLFAGRHILANDLMLAGTGLRDLCTVANGPDALISMCHSIMGQPFTEAEIKKRQSVLCPEYTSACQAEHIRSIIGSFSCP